MSSILDNLQTDGGFQFSATPIDELGASEYTNVTVLIDASGSVHRYLSLLDQLQAMIVQACRKSPRKNNVLLRVVHFDTNLREIHGYKLLSAINAGESGDNGDDYDGVTRAGGMTDLFGAMVTSIDASVTYAKSMFDQEYMSNGVVIALTDGYHNVSGYDEGSVKQAIERAYQSEALESLTTILIGLTGGDQSLYQYFEKIKDDCGFDDWGDADTLDASTIAKIANIISQSVSESSQALANGSTPLPTSVSF